jgi:hypothetical protein
MAFFLGADYYPKYLSVQEDYVDICKRTFGWNLAVFGAD